MRAAFGFGFGLPLGDSGDAPAIDWNFAGGALPSALTFSRASLATMYDAAGALVWCPHNLVVRSGDASDAAWTKNGVSVAGTTVTVTVTGGSKSINQWIGGAPAGPVTLCLRVRAGASSRVSLGLYSGGFVAATASVSSGPGVVSGSGLIQVTGLSAGTQTVVVLQATAPAGGIGVFVYPGGDTAGTNVVGDSVEFDDIRLNVGPLQPYYPTTSAAYYGPRLTYDPVTHSAVGLLVEEQRTNLLLNSLLDGTNLSTQSVTVAATQYTLSFYGTGQVVLSGSATATVVGTGAFPTQKTYTFTPSAGSLTLTVTGTVQFAQLEAGAFATSYIPTAGASATRAADVVTCTGSAFSQWFNASEGTLVVEFVCPSVSSTTYQRAFSMRDNAETKRLEAYIDVSGALTAYLVGSAGDLKVLVGSVTPRAIYKAAIAADASTASAVANGGAVSSLAAAGVLSAMQKLTLGNSGDVSMAGALNSSIKRVRYWRKRLTNAQLQALTA